MEGNIFMSEASAKEQEVLAFWKENNIYSKSKEKNKSGKKFYMMDGPPYASGHIHMGTALNKILKDVAMRSQRLQGKDVVDIPGYDTHGVPIELAVEKEIQSKSRKDIEAFGVDKFVARCREFATQHINAMNDEFANLGVWMSFDKPYITLEDKYIEAIWHAFKEADKKGLLYLGKYPVHVCTRCGTAVAFNEIEYGRQKDNSIYVKFPLKNKENTFLIIWTTTPWTLPANAGVMANPNYNYVEIQVAEGEKWVMAKDLMPKIMMTLERGFTIVGEFKGSDMDGWEFINPLAKNINIKLENSYRVVMSSRYVFIEDGTGLVHCAPGHGKEDYEVGKDNGLAAPSPVSIDGTLGEECGKYAGKKARVVDAEIIEDLEKEGKIVYKHMYEHDYPLCWRDKSPLLMLSLPQWFLKISSVQEKILVENDKTNWVPSWVKLRMKAWLEGISDWPISRQRYWGTPLPIWYDEKTGEKVVVGSIDELKKLSGKDVSDLHKPGIDNIEIEFNGKKLKRVPEVLDVWFDSGVSSFAALGYPSDKQKFERYWPADLNIEGKDQIRGWWNSQFILSQIVFDKKPFDSILFHGMILDMGKKKMSKSVGNAISPESIIEKYGRDYLRYHLAKLSKGEDFSYNEDELKEVHKAISTLLNVNNFVNGLEKNTSMKVEDRWILSRFNSLKKNMTNSYNSYKFNEAIVHFEKFLIFDLSRDYIQIVRERSNEIYDVMQEIRLGLVKLIAPVMPFLAERIWKSLKEKSIVSEESVHLSSLPNVDENKIDEKLEKEFELLSNVIVMGLFERDKAKIGLKWPLAKATIYMKEEGLNLDMLEVVGRQLNVKSVETIDSKEIKVEFDTKMTPALESEGYSREFARNIQAMRKKAGLVKGQMINIEVVCNANLRKYFEENIHFLTERTNAKKINFVDVSRESELSKFEIRGNDVSVKFS